MIHVVDDQLIEKVGHPISKGETMPVKILLKGPDESPEVVKIELSSEKNFFLLYEHTCDVFDYSEMQE